jgi:serine/threonine-protein kinase
MSPRYLPTGHLTYVANGTVFAVPFDADSLEVRGAAVPVLDEISSAVGFGFAQWDVSATGEAVYRGGRTTGRTVVEWVKTDGSTEPLWPEPAFYQFPQLAPDGKRLLVVRADGAMLDIWVYDIERGTKTRVTSGSGVNSYPIWSPDSSHVVFQLGGQLHWVSADGAERPKPLLTTAGASFPASFTPDGTSLMFYELRPGGGSVIATVPVSREGTGLKAGAPQPYREVSANSPVPTLSPNGRWVAYASIESGVYEVYVRAFPDTGRQWAVSTGGGSFPVWSRTSDQLFYRTDDQYVMSASYKVAGDTFVPDKPRRWSAKRLFNSGLIQNFAVAPDGTRVAGLIAEPQGAVTQRHATLVVNFFDQVRRRVATMATQ